MKSLTVRLALSYLLLSLIVLAAAGALSYRQLTAAFRDSDAAIVKAQLDAATRYVVAAQQDHDQPPEVVAATVSKAYPGVRVALRRVDEVEAKKLALKADAIKKKMAAGGKPDSASQSLIATTFTDRTPAGGSAVVMWDQNNQPVAEIQLLPDLGGVGGGGAWQRALLGTFAAALLAAAMLALGFSRYLTAPLNRLAFAAEQIAEGEWETPLPQAGPAEVRRLTDAFRRMAARLQGDFRRLRGDREQLQRLAAEVAHEVKTPIASLRTYHELLLDDPGGDPAERGEMLRRGAAQVSRLEYLANFLVDMARLQAHTAPLERQEADLAELAAAAAQAHTPAFAQRGVTLRSEAGGPLPVLAGPQRVGQALDNLLQNALRYAPAGSTVTLSAAGAGGEASATVADQGPGVPAELLPRLFQPFVRGEGSPGLGLGLAITAAIAESYGGRVTAANRPEGGACFTFSLPLYKCGGNAIA